MNKDCLRYYKNNLDKLGNLKSSDSIQIRYEDKKTHYFALNKESKIALIEFINNIK